MVEKDGATLRVKVDDSDAVKRMQEEIEELKQERDDYEAKLTVLAEQEFSKRATKTKSEVKSKLNLDVDIDTPDELKAYEKMLSQKSGKSNSRDIPLDHNQLGKNSQNSGSIRDENFESISQLWTEVTRRAEKGDEEAQQVAVELAKKGLADLRKDGEAEYQGKVFDIYEKDAEGKLVRKKAGKWKKIR